MNSRERFHLTMSNGKPDRVPYFEEGIREEVLEAWYEQGLAPEANLAEMFSTDIREELDLDIGPHPPPRHWPVFHSELVGFKRRFDSNDPKRLPANWNDLVKKWRDRDHVLMLRVHNGFFLTMGVEDWQRFYEVMRLVKDDPRFVRELMDLQAACAAGLTERILSEVEVDAVIFSEPIGGMHGPLISPKTYRELVLSSYTPILDVARRFEVKTIILRTYANARALIPSQLEAGFNCLWACECETGAMDYHSIRREFGPALRLIGGIDLDALRFGKESIQREVEEQVPPLLESGGFIPLADGRVRIDVPFEDYVYYRRLLEKITSLG